MKNSKKKNITIDELAGMVQKGFTEVHTEIKDFKQDVREQFQEVKEQFKKVDERFDIIENRYIAGHGQQIDKLRDDVIQIKVKLAKMER